MNSLRSCSGVRSWLKKNIAERIGSWLKVYDPSWKFAILIVRIRSMVECIESFAKNRRSFIINIRSFIWKYPTSDSETQSPVMTNKWVTTIGHFQFYNRLLATKSSFSLKLKGSNTFCQKIRVTIVTFSSRIVYFQFKDRIVSFLGSFTVKLTVSVMIVHAARWKLIKSDPADYNSIVWSEKMCSRIIKLKITWERLIYTTDIDTVYRTQCGILNCALYTVLHS